jgi:hypothetical protein
MGIGAISEHFKSPALKLDRERVLFNFRGRNFTAAVIELNKQNVRVLGINPKIFEPGLRVYLLEKSEFSEFSRLANHKTAEGFYPLSSGGLEAKVIEGTLESLPQEGRVMVLPFKSSEPLNCDRRVISHELLHDIFLGNFKTLERDQFYKCVAAWIFKIQKSGFRAEEKDFFKEVSARSAVPFDLAAIRGFRVANAIKENRFSNEFKRFAGECFAYAGELMLVGDDREYLGKVSDEMATYFKMKKILLS